MKSSVLSLFVAPALVLVLGVVVAKDGGGKGGGGSKPKGCTGGLGDINNLLGLWEGTGGISQMFGPYNVSTTDIQEIGVSEFSQLVAITSVSDARQFTATRCGAGGNNIDTPLIGGVAPDLSRAKAKMYFRDSRDPVTFRFATWDFDFFCEDEGQVIFDHDLNNELGGTSGTIGTMTFLKIGEDILCPEEMQ